MLYHDKISMQVVGIDTNTERLELACEKYSASNIEYVEGSAEDIPSVRNINSYDTIFSNFVLHWCKNKDQIFEGIYRILKKGGKFGFTADTDTDVSKVAFTPEIVSSKFLAASKERLFGVSMDEYRHYATNFEILQGNMEYKFPDVHKYIEALRMHTHGDFDMSHFNVDAAKRHFGEGDITFAVPYGTFVLKK